MNLWELLALQKQHGAVEQENPYGTALGNPNFFKVMQASYAGNAMGDAVHAQKYSYPRSAFAERGVNNRKLIVEDFIKRNKDAEGNYLDDTDILGQLRAFNEALMNSAAPRRK